MTITAEERERRRQFICASDMGAILNCDPFRNAHDVFLEKRHGVYETTNEAIDMGNWLERPLVRWAAEEIENRIDDQYLMRTEFGGEFIDGLMMCHPDAVLTITMGTGMFETEVRYLIEAKSTSVSDGWGEPGTDAVPLRVLAQVQIQMLLTDIPVTYIAVVLPRHGRLSRELFVVCADNELQKKFLLRAYRFWDQHVKVDVPPEITPSLVTLKNLIREEQEQPAIVDSALVQAREDSAHALREAKRRDDQCKANLIAALGNNTHGTTDMGHVVTYLEQSRKEQVIKESRFRVLRVKKPKAPNTKG